MLMSMLKLAVDELNTATPSSEIPTPGAKGHSVLRPGSPLEGVDTPPLSPEKSQARVVETYEIYERETELVLPCFIMMLDLVLKQV
jgi:hypothetical protein